MTNASMAERSAEAEVLLGSFAYRAGRLLVDAVKSPRRLPLLPLELYRLFRQARRSEESGRAYTSAAAPWIIRDDSSDRASQARVVPAPACNTQFPREISDLRIAAICDTFTAENLALEARLTLLCPDSWREQLRHPQPHLLFIESAWQGTKGEWAGKVSGADATLRAIVAECRDLGVASVFWNKEDPLHFEAFVDVARLCDVILTTDADMVPEYKRIVGHDRVYLFPFALQPRLHHPIGGGRGGRIAGTVFAGAWYAHHPVRCRDFMNLVDALSLAGPLKLFDRNSGSREPAQRFPDRYYAYWSPAIPYAATAEVFRRYRIGLTLNTIKQSSTMFARRALEVIGAGASVYSNYSKALISMFGDLVVSTDNGDRVLQEAFCELRDPDGLQYRAKRVAALRKVLMEHTWQARLRALIGRLLGRGGPYEPRRRVAIFASAQQQADIGKLAAMVAAQRGVEVEAWVATDDSMEVPRPLRKLSSGQLSKQLYEVAEAGYVTAWHSADSYGDFYLLDMVLALEFEQGEVVGKAAYRVAEEGQSLVWRAPGLEYCRVQKLAVRRALLPTGRWEGTVAEYLAAIDSGELTGDDLVSIDGLSYAENTGGAVLPEAGFWPRDTGWSLEEIQTQLDAMPKAPVSSDIQLTGGELSRHFEVSHEPALSLSERNGLLELVCKLDVERTICAFSDTLPRELLERNGTVKVRVEGRPHSAYDFRLHGVDADGRTVVTVPMPTGTNVSLDPPNSIQGYRIELRVWRSLVAYVEGIRISGWSQSAILLPGRRSILIVVNRYPSADDLYRNAFIHRRVLAYRRLGFTVDVVCVSRSSASLSYEFEDVHVRVCDPETLRETLRSSGHQVVAAHFMDRDMWLALQDFVHAGRVVVWLHGSEAQPWSRRAFNFGGGQAAQVAKQESDARMHFWRQLVSAPPRNLRLTFVSATFAEEFQHDVAMALPQELYRVIHNPTDTRLFRYIEKTADQRSHIALVRPHHSRVYANDIAAQVIEALAEHECFASLRFTLVGDGPLFEENFLALAKYANVRIIRQFLPQCELAQIYHDHGIFLVPTRGDTQGVSRDEAMACGLVPVTNAVGAVGEFVDTSCCVLAPPDGVEEMVDGILRLIDDPELFLRMSKAAASRVRRQSAVDIVTPQELEWLLEGIRGDLASPLCRHQELS